VRYGKNRYSILPDKLLSPVYRGMYSPCEGSGHILSKGWRKNTANIRRIYFVASSPIRDEGGRVCSAVEGRSPSVVLKGLL